jgi:hypothetical protein
MARTIAGRKKYKTGWKSCCTRHVSLSAKSSQKVVLDFEFDERTYLVEVSEEVFQPLTLVVGGTHTYTFSAFTTLSSRTMLVHCQFQMHNCPFAPPKTAGFSISSPWRV